MSPIDKSISDDANYCKEIGALIADSDAVASLSLDRDSLVRILKDIGQFVLISLRDDSLPFVPKAISGGKQGADASRLAKVYAPRLPIMIQVASHLTSENEYEVLVEVFCKCARELNEVSLRHILSSAAWYGRRSLSSTKESLQCDEIFNEFVDRVRVVGSSCRALERHKEVKRDAESRYREYVLYLLALMMHCGRIVVLRLDLGYRKDAKLDASMDTLNDDVARLLHNRRSNKIFRGLLGYVIKMEWGVERGAHAHALIILNAMHRDGRKHSYLAESIGKYWKEVIAKDRGVFHNCNQNESAYERFGKNGIGLIDLVDGDKFMNLVKYVLPYLCKSSSVARPKANPAMRVIRRGLLPKECKSTAPKFRNKVRVELSDALRNSIQKFLDPVKDHPLMTKRKYCMVDRGSRR
ncbi:YagK/YfjJ domain-containing protein [Zoogloea dura]|uniref:Inovirus-type Gp2 protein n=1 Tax=Zoogloea dura TaxID=2728840 RepID=A0A848G038_9RHOO|nr:inovirus-type Gp2 protein [Zoogloea dura]NML24425.1 inovirus-type Gp2 protein [Zoogloea dura]